VTIARTVLSELQSRQIPYEVVVHPHRETTRDAAASARVPLDRMAKAVVLVDRQGYLMVVVPGDRFVDLKELRNRLGRDLEFAPEPRLVPVFNDCEAGAIPPLGPAYGMETVVDHNLVGLPDVYFVGGDHSELLRVKGDRFLALLTEARYVPVAH